MKRELQEVMKDQRPNANALGDVITRATGYQGVDTVLDSLILQAEEVKTQAEETERTNQIKTLERVMRPNGFSTSILKEQIDAARAIGRFPPSLLEDAQRLFEEKRTVELQVRVRVTGSRWRARARVEDDGEGEDEGPVTLFSSTIYSLTVHPDRAQEVVRPV